MRRIAPIFPVQDIEAALAHYERLGFAVRMYRDGGYGFAVWDGVELHLGTTQAEGHCPGAAYLFVEDADELAAIWMSSGIDVHPPQDTPWGQREGVLVDADGNVVRFGSPLDLPE
jgi:hypothetical protein